MYTFLWLIATKDAEPDTVGLCIFLDLITIFVVLILAMPYIR